MRACPQIFYLGIYPLGSPSQYLNIVLFFMVKIGRNDSFRLNNASPSLAPVKSRTVYLSGAGLPRLSWKEDH